MLGGLAGTFPVVTVKTKAAIAGALCVIFILITIPLAFFSNNLSGLSLTLGLVCGLRAAKWRKEIGLEKDKLKDFVRDSTYEAKRRAFIRATIVIVMGTLIGAPLLWYLSPALQDETPIYIISFIVTDALVIFGMWRKFFPSSK